MTPDQEIRAAAEKIRNVKDNESFNQVTEADLWPLANAYLAEHPADSDEPVTFGWAMALPDVGLIAVHAALECANDTLLAVGYDGEVSIVQRTNVIAVGSMTRGGFRQLLTALQIKPAEVC